MKKLLLLACLLFPAVLYGADAKVTELDSVVPTGDDLLYIVDDPDGTPVSKKATVSATVGAANAATATALAADGANCNAGNAPRGVDASGVVQDCFDVATQAELNTHMGDAGAHAAGIAGTAATATLAATASALAANGANCSAGSAPLGVDAAGAVEGCFDVGTQTELDAHINDATGAHAASAVSVDSTNLDGTGTDLQTVLEELEDQIDALVGVDEAGDYDWTGQHTFADTIGTLTSAGAFGAGSCTASGFHGIDTTAPAPYWCKELGETPLSFGALGDNYSQITAESGSSTAVGAATLNITCTPNCTTTAADASPDTLVITISNHVKSVYFPANALTTDGAQCANPALATINSGPRIWTIICTDNDGSTIYGHAVMPDSWDAGTVTFELEAVQTANETNVMNSDIAAMCRGAGETINNTWGTEVAMDDAAVGGNSIVDHTTSAAVTANGTCAAGDSLFFRWQLDAGGTTTAVASYHILGFKMEYTVTGAGSD